MTFSVLIACFGCATNKSIVNNGANRDCQTNNAKTALANCLFEGNKALIYFPWYFELPLSTLAKITFEETPLFDA